MHAVYYAALAVAVAWRIIARKVARPVTLLRIGAHIVSVVFVIASIHLLKLITRGSPAALRPPLRRRCALVGKAVIHACFALLGGRALL